MFKAENTFFNFKTMEKKEIHIPKGCNKINIDINEGVMLVFYESKINDRIFDCPETGEQEERPGIGDFAIFWNREFKNRVCCANFCGMINGKYISSNNFTYDEAIKFRDYEQFLKIRGIYAED